MKMRSFMGLIAAALLTLAVAAPFVSADELINCMPAATADTGDRVDRGFYIESYPGVTLEQVLLRFEANIAGSYTYRMTVRRDAYDGIEVGTAEKAYTFTKTDVAIPIRFDFDRLVVTSGSRITFEIEQLSGPGGTSYDVRFSQGCPITQTNGTTPPLDSFRRSGITALVYGSTTAPDHTHFIEDPRPGVTYSGIGLIRGWVCDAKKVVVEIEGGSPIVPVSVRDPQATPAPTVFRAEAAHGTIREDTIGVCSDIDNGYGLLFNWNRLGDGEHTLRVYADGVELGASTFTVQTLLEEYLTGVSGRFVLEDFPFEAETVLVEWVESLQNFMITGFEPVLDLVP